MYCSLNSSRIPPKTREKKKIKNKKKNEKNKNAASPKRRRSLSAIQTSTKTKVRVLTHFNNVDKSKSNKICNQNLTNIHILHLSILKYFVLLVWCNRAS